MSKIRQLLNVGSGIWVETLLAVVLMAWAFAMCALALLLYP